jgi:hypothetical protein
VVTEGQVGGHKRGNYFYMCIFEKIFQNETFGQFQSNLGQTYLAGWEFKFIITKRFKSSTQRVDNHKSAKIG